MTLRPFKKIKEQEEIINRLQIENNFLKSKEENKKGKSKHDCGVWCVGCENLMKEQSWNALQGKYEMKFCKLDISCNDRRE